MRFKFKHGQLVCIKSKYHNSFYTLHREDKPRPYLVHTGQVGLYVADYNRSKCREAVSGPRMVVLFGEELVEMERKYLSVVK